MSSKIEWTEETWNPVTGCTRVSAGCDNCYAARMSKRLEGMGQEKYTGINGRGHFNGVVKWHPDELEKPLRWRKPRTVFVCSMSDLFHPEVPFDFIDHVFGAMFIAEKHTFQVLTKRPWRMAEYLNSRRPDSMKLDRRVVGTELGRPREGYSVSWPLPNVWLGTSVEDQQAAEDRIPQLLKCPAAVRFLSCEPLLGEVDLADLVIPILGAGGGYWHANAFDPADDSEWNGATIDWVICGGESGPNARPMHPVWARTLRDHCVQANVPFFFKQWGEYVPNGQEDSMSEGARMGIDAEQVAPMPINGVECWKVGKKHAGHLLDGLKWNQMPEREEEYE